MRLAVLSDIHGNSAALRAVLADIERRNVDLTVNLGDCFSGPLDAGGTADLLRRLDLPTVSGNHDRLLVDRPKDEMGNWEAWAIDDLDRATLDWVASLPMTLSLGDVFLCHATPTRDDENWLDHRGPDQRLIARDLDAVLPHAKGIDANLILCGHTHTPRSLRLPDGRRIVNPGSVGCPGYHDQRTEPSFIHQTGSADARYAVVDSSSGEWVVDLISVPYDATEMMALAEKNSAPHWITVLKQGWFA